MPYYIYRIRPPAHLEYIDTREHYQEAKQLVRSLRSTQGENETMVRLLFAKSTGEAERLLSVPRDPRVIGED